MEFKKYYRIRIETVDATQTVEPVEIQADPSFSKTVTFPIGSYILKHKNGQQQIMEELTFLKYYKEMIEN